MKVLSILLSTYIAIVGLPLRCSTTDPFFPSTTGACDACLDETYYTCLNETRTNMAEGNNNNILAGGPHASILRKRIVTKGQDVVLTPEFLACLCRDEGLRMFNDCSTSICESQDPETFQGAQRTWWMYCATKDHTLCTIAPKNVTGARLRSHVCWKSQGRVYHTGKLFYKVLMFCLLTFNVPMTMNSSNSTTASSASTASATDSPTSNSTNQQSAGVITTARLPGSPWLVGTIVALLYLGIF